MKTIARKWYRQVSIPLFIDRNQCHNTCTDQNRLHDRDRYLNPWFTVQSNSDCEKNFKNYCNDI